MSRSPLPEDPQQNEGHRNVPILPSSDKSPEHIHSDPMDVTPPTSATMGPPVHSSPEMDLSSHTNGTFGDVTPGQNGISTNGLSAAAATSSQQPKVVQTAFIHKLYKLVMMITPLKIPP